MKVCYMLRDSRQGGKSIEEIFKRIIAFHEDSLAVKAEIFQYDSTRSLWSNLRRLRRINADIYHNTGSVHFLNIFLWRKPTIVTVHDLGHFHQTLKGIKKVLYGIYNVYLPLLLSTRISVISKFTRDELIRTVPLLAKKIVVIHNPYPNLFRSSPKLEEGGTTRILQIGTGANKNVERVAKALSGLDCHLTILGPLSSTLEECLTKSKVNYSSLENLSYSEVYELYCKTNIVMFPSTFEGFGMPIIEANAVGRPVITSEMEPMLEIGGDAALFVDPYDVTSIRSAIQRLKEDTNLSKRLVANGHKNIKRFEIETIARQYYQLYQAVINEN